MGAFEDRQRESMLDPARSSFAYDPMPQMGFDLEPQPSCIGAPMARAQAAVAIAVVIVCMVAAIFALAA